MIATLTWAILQSSAAETAHNGSTGCSSPLFARGLGGMVTLLQLALNGLALGAAYALVALGFVLVLNATSAVNFAQGDMVMAGGYVAIALAGALPVPGMLLLPLVLVLMAALGLVVAALAYLPLAARPPARVFISTIAAGIVLQHRVN